jgi:ABC-type nitrate/sulfonate/bicarbonate transport system substrate-binding protein
MRPLLLVGLALFLVACAAPATTPPATSSPAGASAPGPAATAAPGPGAAAASSTPPPLERIRVAYGAVTGAYLTTFMAKEGGILARYGFDAELQAIPAGPTLIQAMLAGEVHFGESAAPAPMAAQLEGGDTVYLASAMDQPVLLMVAAPEIARMEDLRQRIVGANRVGTLTYQMTRLALQASGLEAGRDVTVQQVGGQPELVAAMASGQVVAGLLGPPAHLQAIQNGSHVISNIADSGILWPFAGAYTTRRQIAEQPERTRNFVRAYTEAIYMLRADRERSIDVLLKYAAIDDRAVAAETYDYLRDRFNLTPFPNPAAFELVVNEDLAQTNPRARDLPIQDYYDDRFVRELDQSGFLRDLSARYPGAR